MKRILFAAPSSGTGKTTITCGFLRALQKRGIAPVSFKCGPDYIDPLFHSCVLGIPAYTIDTFLTTPEMAKALFMETARGKDIVVLEGVMGYYDGLAGKSLQASTYDVAALTKTPVVLVVRPKGMSRSIVPLLQGFCQYQKESYIKGVILNGVSPMVYLLLKEVIEKELPLKVCGYLPEKEQFSLESRHLGLVLPQEVEKWEEKLDSLAEQMEQTIDIDGILQLAEETELWETTAIPIEKSMDCTIAVAKDAAFCFYYEENIRYLVKKGCKIVYFSPLKDEKLGKKVNGLLLGGGYPELYGKVLAENISMRQSIAESIEKGMPVWAECGGFLYLHEILEDKDGKCFPMVGSISGKGFPVGKLQRFGYVTLTAQKDTPFCKKGEKISAHEFHYWDSTNNGDTFLAEKPLSKRTWQCIHQRGNVFAGFPHIHFYSNRTIVDRFLQKCATWREGQEDV